MYLQAAACGMRQLMLMLELGLGDVLPHNAQIHSAPWPLMDILERNRQASSTDPHDRVYAFLNLCSDQQELGLSPDYHASVHDTFIRAAQTLTQAGYGPRVLCNACALDGSVDLSSWVPNGSLDGLPFERLAGEASIIQETFKHNAGGSAHNIRVGVETTDLLVDVVTINTIAGLSQIRRY